MTDTSTRMPQEGVLTGGIRRLSLIQRRAASPQRHLAFAMSAETEALAAQQRQDWQDQKQARIAARKTDHFEAPMLAGMDPTSPHGERWIYARKLASHERQQERFKNMLSNMAVSLGLSGAERDAWVAIRMERRNAQRARQRTKNKTVASCFSTAVAKPQVVIVTTIAPQFFTPGTTASRSGNVPSSTRNTRRVRPATDRGLRIQSL